MRSMPAQRPGKSTQEVGTPREFLDAVIERFGRFCWDLAADEANHVVPGWSGPGSKKQSDALKGAWWALPPGLRWLNPPFGRIAPWAKKAAQDSDPRRRTALLVPASVGSNWYADHIHGKALVLFLHPRLTFVGHSQPYPKDLMLVVFGVAPGIECWRWDQ